MKEGGREGGRRFPCPIQTSNKEKDRKAGEETLRNSETINNFIPS